LRTLDLSWINTLSNLQSWLLPLPLSLLPSLQFDNHQLQLQGDTSESHQGVKKLSSHHPSIGPDHLHHSNQMKVCHSLLNLLPHPLHQEQQPVNDLYPTLSLNTLKRSNTRSHALHPPRQVWQWIPSQSPTSTQAMFSFRNLNRWLLQLLQMGSLVDS